MKSESVVIKPVDSRCRFWAKIVRAGSILPIPSDVQGANDIPGAYLPAGDEELFFGDFLITGEAMHHRHNRGWMYKMAYVTEAGLSWVQYSSERKAAAKAAGLPKELLPGSGDIAGLVRLAHAVRLGLDIGPVEVVK